MHGEAQEQIWFFPLLIHLYCLVGCLSIIVWTHAVLGALYACILYFCICTCSAQLSMFDMGKRSRNPIITIIIIVVVVVLILLLLYIILLLLLIIIIIYIIINIIITITIIIIIIIIIIVVAVAVILLLLLLLYILLLLLLLLIICAPNLTRSNTVTPAGDGAGQPARLRYTDTRPASQNPYPITPGVFTRWPVESQFQEAGVIRSGSILETPAFEVDALPPDHGDPCTRRFDWQDRCTNKCTSRQRDAHF